MTGSRKLTSTAHETSPLAWFANVSGGLVAPAIESCEACTKGQEPRIASNFAAGSLQVYAGIGGDDLKRGSHS